MASYKDEITSLETKESAFQSASAKVARFAYTQQAYDDNTVDGVAAYNYNQEQNIPVGSASYLDVNQTVIDKGVRTESSSITRQSVNHFFGRTSYNLNKVHDNFKSFLTHTKNYIGEANGIASLDENGRIPYSQLPESAMEYKGTWNASTNTPTLADGAGTNGDFYVVSIGGTQTFGGVSISFNVNDRIICTRSGTSAVWTKLASGEATNYDDIANLITRNGNRSICKQLGLEHTEGQADTVANIQSAIELLKANYAGYWKTNKIGLGDYFDLPSVVFNGSTISWNGTYKNLRVIIVANPNNYKSYYSDTYGVNGITFMFLNCITVNQFNSSMVSYGSSCELRNKVSAMTLGGINASDLGSNYRYFADQYTDTYDITTVSCQDKIFIPSAQEIFSHDRFSCRNNFGNVYTFPLLEKYPQYRYALYNGSSSSWWLCNRASASYVCYVSYGIGRLDHDSPNAVYGVRPCFMIATT